MNLDFFDSFPALSTPRLLLRELVPEDTPALFEVFRDEEVTRFYDVETMTEIAPAAGIIARMRQRYAERQAIRWAIVEKSDGGFLGTLGFNAFNFMSDRAVLGYELARRAWGKGFATEAVREVVRFGHAQVGLNRIEAVVMPGNEASVNVLRKVGFEEEGLLRAFGRWKGRYHDLRMFSVLRERAGD